MAARCIIPRAFNCRVQAIPLCSIRLGPNPSKISAMSSKQGGKAKPLKQPKVDKKEYDEVDMANIQKKKDEEKALRELRAKAQQKGTFGGAGLKKSGKK
ncbi:translation machinery-associated protein 7 [Momordica charantia]|uniref:Translation machinery-associated protein 7 n=1 Tax=Momordica charantia TaxID=3673 RepID=A0A6J1CWS4_MOMCH|nr:translation machinery-associated protein 7 [Momordica charantia]